MRRAPTSLASLLILTVLAGCGGGDADDAGAEAADSAARPGGLPVLDGPRVPMGPTAEGELPPAIIGEGGALMGTNLKYVPGDTLSTGYLAVPEGVGPFPGLVIVHEWNGLTDRVRQVADDFAAEGYVTLAVDLYEGRTGSNPDENMALVRAVNADQPKMIANMNAAVSYLKSLDHVSGRVGAMGWCFGGGIALSFGLDGDDHDATAIFYGALVDDPDRLAAMDHEVYGTFAREDPGPSPDDVAAFEEALRAAGIENDLHIYDEVGHGFWLRVDQEPEVRTAPALDAWQRLKAYLDRTLGDGM